MNYLNYLLASGIFNISLMIIIGIIYLTLFILTIREEPETSKYSIWLSIGFTLIFIITPIISYGSCIINYLDLKGYYEKLFFYNSPYVTLEGILNISFDFLYGIGLILSTIGAYKTMKVPLRFVKLRRKETRTEKILKKYKHDLASEPFKEED